MLHFLEEIKKNTRRYHYFTPVYQKSSWWNDLQFLRYRAWQTEGGNLRSFLPFYPPNDPENQSFEKMKRALGDIIILQMCTIKGNHTMYVSWDMEHHVQNFLSFCAVFCLFTPQMNVLSFWTICHFTPLITWKINILKKWKKFIFSIWNVFCPFTPLASQKIKILKKWKKRLEILSFYTCVP